MSPQKVTTFIIICRPHKPPQSKQTKIATSICQKSMEGYGMQLPLLHALARVFFTRIYGTSHGARSSKHLFEVWIDWVKDAHPCSLGPFIPSALRGSVVGNHQPPAS